MDTTDDCESGFNASEHLVEANCKRIAFLFTSMHLSITNKRMNGYINALKKNNIPFDPCLLVECNNDNDQNLQVFKDLLLSDNRPDAIIEKLVITPYHIWRDISIRIPQDLKVISFSNLRTASLLASSLSTITQPAFEIGREAASVLFRQIEKKI